jgi:hypothetical protein
LIRYHLSVTCVCNIQLGNYLSPHKTFEGLKIRGEYDVHARREVKKKILKNREEWGKENVFNKMEKEGTTVLSSVADPGCLSRIPDPKNINKREG